MTRVNTRMCLSFMPPFRMMMYCFLPHVQLLSLRRHNRIRCWLKLQQPPVRQSRPPLR